MTFDEVNINLTLRQKELRRLPHLENIIQAVQLQSRYLKIKTKRIKRPVTQLLDVLIK